MINLKNLNTKDKLLIAKALTDIATAIYKDNTDFILNQILKTDDKSYQSDYGMFWKQTNKAKTVQDLINANDKKIAELQEENKTLGTYADKTTIIKEETTILKSKHTALADEIALELLQIADLDSKRLNKSASKIKNK